ncbi:lipid II:glycine glycyltransferase FemX [Maricaulis sp. D1M11]|uniref:lipid II:glycine glycyltransferase FemX n=1 Tax=Maricaulis sp. D1M11 TaxID=3076117 RepID=UPI0039B426E0
MEIRTGLSRPRWDSLIGDQPVSLQQDWCYGAAMETLGAQIIRAELGPSDNPLALAQITTRKLGGMLTLALTLRGPVWRGDVSDGDKRAVYRTLKSRLGLGWPRITLFSPDETETTGTQGLARVTTGYSTVMLDLQPDLDALRKGFNGKWRNRLVAAEKSDLKIQVNGTKPAQYLWLLETEDGQRQARGYRATPGELVPAFVEAKGDRNSLLILRADLGKQKAAAMLFLIHGRAATYHIGWSSDEGRKLGAHNLLLWSALGALKDRGVTQLDLGGVNTQSGAGIARFKIGTGGQVVTYSGSWT